MLPAHSLTTDAAAWFEIYLKGDHGLFYDLVYGGGPDSLCQYQPMAECVVGGRVVVNKQVAD